MKSKICHITRILVFCFTFALMSSSAWGQSKHEVIAGETLYSISQTYGVTVQAIQAVNPGLGDTIMTGQTINIPAKSTQEPIPQQHLIIRSTDIMPNKPVRRETKRSTRSTLDIPVDSERSPSTSYSRRSLKRSSDMLLKACFLMESLEDRCSRS